VREWLAGNTAEIPQTSDADIGLRGPIGRGVGSTTANSFGRSGTPSAARIRIIESPEERAERINCWSGAAGGLSSRSACEMWSYGGTLSFEECGIRGSWGKQVRSLIKYTLRRSKNNRYKVNFSRSTCRFLPFQVLSFTQSNCRDFVANDEWLPIHPTSIHWIIMLRGNAGVLSQAATEAENSSRV